MKISYNWLSQYVDLPADIKELSDKLTMAGVEVEGIETKGSIPDGIVVGEILERKQHPDADKLSICRVSDGTQELQIVCGAPNCDAGKKVPLATLGTVFNDEESGKKFAIKKCKLRGVESSGMLCSARELGLSKDHSGLMELPSEYKTGTPFKDIVKGDTVFELEITPNRPDLLSHWGIARDVAAITGRNLKFPNVTVPGPEKDGRDYSNLVEVRDNVLCPRYTARVIRNVKIKESPDWLKERLESVGLRPINNIVDITNFILMALGQPLHAFDLDELAGQRIIVRRAGEGETMMTLDGKINKLNSSNLVIADAEKPVALAGIMGGEHSGVTEKTVNILLESAAFFSSNIRSSSRNLGISSDSSYRFERGIDIEMVKTAGDRAAALIVELAGGEIVTDFIDVRASEKEQCVIECRFDYIRRQLGIDLKNEGIADIFRKLGLFVSEESATGCKVTIPSFRLDLEREADLGEEVARIYGLDKIPVKPVNSIIVDSIAKDAYLEIETLRNELISIGLYEGMNYSMCDEKTATADGLFQKEDLVTLNNPISSEFAYMRPSLFSGVLRSLDNNISRKNYDIALFEIGTVFCANKNKYPEERLECCIVMTGRRHPERYSVERGEVLDFFDLKGLLETWLAHRRFKKVEFKKSEDSRFEKSLSAEISVNGKVIGSFGMVAKKFVDGMRTQFPVYMAVIQVGELLNIASEKIMYKPYSQYPSTARDVAFVADESLEHSKIVDFILKSKPENLEKVELFDIFRDENTIGKARKSMAYSLTFRHSERTLTDDEVNKAHENLRTKLASGLGVELR